MYQYALKGSVQNKLAISIDHDITPSQTANNDEELMQQLIQLSESHAVESEMLRDQIKELKKKLSAAESKITELEASQTLTKGMDQLSIGNYVVKDFVLPFLE